MIKEKYQTFKKVIEKITDIQLYNIICEIDEEWESDIDYSKITTETRFNQVECYILILDEKLGNLTENKFYEFIKNEELLKCLNILINRIENTNIKSISDLKNTYENYLRLIKK